MASNGEASCSTIPDMSAKSNETVLRVDAPAKRSNDSEPEVCKRRVASNKSRTFKKTECKGCGYVIKITSAHTQEVCDQYRLNPGKILKREKNNESVRKSRNNNALIPMLDLQDTINECTDLIAFFSENLSLASGVMYVFNNLRIVFSSDTDLNTIPEVQEVITAIECLGERVQNLNASQGTQSTESV